MAINQKQDGDRGYIAILENKRIEVYAPSSYQAQLRAASHLRPSKRKMGLLSVTLAELEDGSQVTHSTASL